MNELKFIDLPRADTVLDTLTAGGIVVICAMLAIHALQGLLT